MKRSELIFNIIFVPLDFVMLFLAGTMAYHLRISEWMRNIRPITREFTWTDMLPFILAFALVSLLFFALSGLYRMHVTRPGWRELYIIGVSVSTTVLVCVLYFFFDREFFSRAIVLLMWLLSIGLVFGGRLLVRTVQRFLSGYRGIGVHRIAVIGETESGEALKAGLSETEYGYRVVHTAPKFREAELTRLAEEDKLDEVGVTFSDMELDELERIKHFCDRHHLAFLYTPTLFETSQRLEVHNLAGVLLFKVKRSNLEGWGSVLKRMFDIMFASVFLAVFSPVYAIISLGIKFDSRGPVIYKNERVGRSGRVFLLWKFRTMYAELCTSENNQQALEYERKLIEEQSVKEGPIYKIKDDPRVTPFGAFLRKTSLDELPQFVNVLKGDMSVVGPRPHQPREVEGYENKHYKLLSVKPGITGLAQISGRSDLSFEEEVRYDMYYIEHWSFREDIRIIVQTPFAMLISREVD